MNDELKPVSPRQRLQELLAIPERQRTDPEWDEINELEIQLASSNRLGAPEPGARRNAPSNNNSGQPRPAGGPHGKKPYRKFHKKRPSGDAR